MARNATQGGQKSYADLDAELSRLKTDLGSLTDTLGDVASAEARETLSRVRERLDSLRGDARSAAANLSEQAREQADAFEGKVRENPIASVLIALGLGFVLGALLRR